MTNTVDCNHRYPIAQGRDFGLSIIYQPITDRSQYDNPEKFLYVDGDFWTIAAQAAVSFAKYERGVSKSFIKKVKTFIPRQPGYPDFKLQEFTSTNLLIEPTAFAEIDVWNAMQALEKSKIPDALWLMMVTEMITQAEIDKRSSFHDMFNYHAILDRVLQSR